MSLQSICGKICVRGCGDHVVEEGEVLADVLCGPVRKVCVQQALITTVK